MDKWKLYGRLVCWSVASSGEQYMDSLVKVEGEGNRRFLVLQQHENDFTVEGRSVTVLPFDGQGGKRRVPLSKVAPAEKTQEVSFKEGLASVVAHDILRPSGRFGHGIINLKTIIKKFQFRPLLKYIDDPLKRILIADETGLGKTVEAGYILSFEIANSRASRVIIICPSHLKRKWKDELWELFGLHFTLISGSRLRSYLLHGFPSSFYWIVSLDAGRSLGESMQLIPSEMLDLLIIDEVHNCIARAGESIRRSFCIALSNAAESVLGLSATPINLEEKDLLRILDVIRPGALNYQEFAKELEVNAILNETYLMLSLPSLESSTIHKLRIAARNIATLAKSMEGDRRESIVAVVEGIRSLDNQSSDSQVLNIRELTRVANSFYSWMTRTMKKEVGESRERVVCKEMVELNQEVTSAVQHGIKVEVSESSLYQETDDLLKTHFAYVHRRQLSSCLPPMKQLIRDGRQGYNVWKRSGAELSTTDLELGDEDESTPCVQHHKLDEAAKKDCTALLDKFMLLNADSKWSRLVSLIRDLKNKGLASKCIVFTEWRPTIEYFKAKAEDLQDISTYVVKGTASNWIRRRTLREFMESEGYAVLFASDVMAEGINITAADCVINYDLPHNPQRLEQRIGRVDRIGQTSDSVRLISLLVKDSIDESIHEILINRLKAFERGIGPMALVLEGQMHLTETFDDVKKEDLLAEVERRDVLQNHPALRVFDSHLDEELTNIDEPTTSDSSSLTWLVLYPLILSIAGESNCAFLSDGTGFTCNTTEGLRATIASMSSENRDEIVHSLVRGTKNGATFFTTGKKIQGFSLPNNHSIIQRAAKALTNSIYSPEDGTLYAEFSPQENWGLQANRKYALVEFAFRGLTATKREWFVFVTQSDLASAIMVSNPSPLDLIKNLCRLEGHFSVVHDIAQPLLDNCNVLKAALVEWESSLLQEDLSKYLLREGKNVEKLENRSYALEKRIHLSTDPLLRSRMENRLQLVKNELSTQKIIWEDVCSGRTNHQEIEALVILLVGVDVANE